MNPPLTNGDLLNALEAHPARELSRIVVAGMEGRPLGDTDELLEKLTQSRARRAIPMNNEDDLPAPQELQLGTKERFQAVIGDSQITDAARATVALGYHFATWTEVVTGQPEEASADRLSALLKQVDEKIAITVALKAAASKRPRWVRIIEQTPESPDGPKPQNLYRLTRAGALYVQQLATKGASGADAE